MTRSNNRGQMIYEPVFPTLAVMVIVGVFVVAEVNDKLEDVDPETIETTCAGFGGCGGGTGSEELFAVFLVVAAVSILLNIALRLYRRSGGVSDRRSDDPPDHPPARPDYVAGEITLDEYERRVWVWLIAEDSPPVEEWPTPQDGDQS